jgi:hypothetical protein
MTDRRRTQLHRTFRGILLGAASAAITACVSASGPPAEPSFAGWESADEIRLEVLNHNFADVTVWMVARDAARSRLGVVTGKTEETFVVPWAFTQPLRLEFDLLAGPRCQTRSMSVDPGDILQLEIQAVFRDTEGCALR